MKAALELLDRMFTEARTHKHWVETPISQGEFDIRLRKAYDLAKWVQPV